MRTTLLSIVTSIVLLLNYGCDTVAQSSGTISLQQGLVLSYDDTKYYVDTVMQSPDGNETRHYLKNKSNTLDILVNVFNPDQGLYNSMDDLHKIAAEKITSAKKSTYNQASRRQEEFSISEVEEKEGYLRYIYSIDGLPDDPDYHYRHVHGGKADAAEVFVQVIVHSYADDLSIVEEAWEHFAKGVRK